jgi:hypothetical protein
VVVPSPEVEGSLPRAVINKEWEQSRVGAIAPVAGTNEVLPEHLPKNVVKWAAEPDHIADASKGIWHFVGSVFTNLGITDILQGTAHLTKDVAEVVWATGRAGLLASDAILGGRPDDAGTRFHEELERALKESGQSVESARQILRGAGKLGMELFGVADAQRAMEATSKGDYVQAAFYGALVGAQVIGMVGFFGVGGLGVSGLRAGMSQSLKGLAKEGFEIYAKGMSGEVVETLSKAVGDEMLERARGEALQEIDETIVREAGLIEIPAHLRVAASQGDDAARAAVKELSQRNNELAKALGGSRVREIAAASSEKHIGALLDNKELFAEIGVESFEDLVAEVTEKHLILLSEMKPRALEAILQRGGASASKAAEMAKGMRAALGRVGARGSADEFEEELIEEISKVISKDVKEDLGKRGFGLGGGELDGMMSRFHERFGLDDSPGGVLQQWKKDIAQGYDEGFEKAVLERVRRGVQSGFERFRKGDFDLGGTEPEEIEPLVFSQLPPSELAANPKVKPQVKPVVEQPEPAFNDYGWVQERQLNLQAESREAMRKEQGALNTVVPFQRAKVVESPTPPVEAKSSKGEAS